MQRVRHPASGVQRLDRAGAGGPQFAAVARCPTRSLNAGLVRAATGLETDRATPIYAVEAIRPTDIKETDYGKYDTLQPVR